MFEIQGVQEEIVLGIMIFMAFFIECDIPLADSDKMGKEVEACIRNL